MIIVGSWPEATLKAETLRQALEDAMDEDQATPYFGMSQLGRCPRALYQELAGGWKQPPGLAGRRRMHEGRLHQADILERLSSAGIEVARSWHELVALDGRLTGHIRELVEGELLEIHSVEDDDVLERIRERGPRPYDVAQIQAYCHFGHFERALVVYKSRASGRVWVVWVRYDAEVGARLEAKARMILAALDSGVEPECDCAQHAAEGLEWTRG